MKKDRLIAFTDAVLAIIMTILILELENPQSPAWKSFMLLRDSLFSYALSFFWLGSLWAALNIIWEKVVRINSTVVFWNLVLLFLASFMPYATGLVSIYMSVKLVQGFYGMIVILTTVCNWILHDVLEKADPSNLELARITRSYRRALIPDILIKLVGLALAFLVYPQSMMYSVLAAAAYMFLFRSVQSRKEKKTDPSPVEKS